MLKTILDNDEIMQKYNVITFGIESDAQFKAVDIKEENGSTSLMLNTQLRKSLMKPMGRQFSFLCGHSIYQFLQ